MKETQAPLSYRKVGDLMPSHNEACLRYADGCFQNLCPTCGLAGPLAERAQQAILGWVATLATSRYTAGLKKAPEGFEFAYGHALTRTLWASRPV